MNPNKALWEKGDFTRISRSMRDSGAALVDTFAITGEMKVLDLGCGDGTTAVPAARLAREVIGIDIASNLVAAGNARVAAEGLSNLRFEEGDASDLRDVPDAGFDLVISIFGAMFAPRPYDVAREMVRVTRAGGRIVMGNWIPNDPTLVAQVLKISAAHAPPPPDGFVSPMLWGVESEVIDRFTAAGIDPAAIALERASYAFTYPGPPSELLETFVHFYGPTMSAMEHAEANGTAAQLKAELLTLFQQENKSSNAEMTQIAAAFLRVTVSKGQHGD